MSYANILKPCAYTYSAIIAHMQDNTSPTPNKTKNTTKQRIPLKTQGEVQKPPVVLSFRVLHVS